jgi:ComF family protein
MSNDGAPAWPHRPRGPGLPSQCAVCRAWGRARICADCAARFAAPLSRCTACALRVPTGVARCADCVRAAPPFDAAVAAVDYAYPWDALVTAFKFHGALDVGPGLAGLLAQALRRTRAPRPDLLLPVPLGPARLAERGYNQAWELAKGLRRTLAVPADARVLQRLFDGPHQAGRPRGERAAQVRDSFGIAPRAAARLRGAGIALVDDVMTTGSTLAEAARVLKAAGAASVQVWVVARTPAPQDR